MNTYPYITQINMLIQLMGTNISVAYITVCKNYEVFQILHHYTPMQMNQSSMAGQPTLEKERSTEHLPAV